MHTSPRAKGVCMRCGFKYDLCDLSKEWTGLRVCSDCYDYKPRDLSPPRIRPEGLFKPNASPEPPDRFVVPGVDEATPDDL